MEGHKQKITAPVTIVKLKYDMIDTHQRSGAVLRHRYFRLRKLWLQQKKKQVKHLHVRSITCTTMSRAQSLTDSCTKYRLGTIG